MKSYKCKKSAVNRLSFIIFFSFMLFCVSCGDNTATSVNSKAETYPSTYSFFDVDVNSTHSISLKRRLDNILGDHAVETRGTINLNINNTGLLKEHLPYFDGLNQRLNSPTGKPLLPAATSERKISLIPERVEHNTLKLVYRYAVNKNLPFTQVEFLFSKFNDTPLLIRVKFKKDDLNIVDNLHQKYGTPREILWTDKNGKSLFWEKDGDILILSFVPDQFGKPVYEVAIYFSKRIEDLLESERLEREGRQKKGVKSGQNVF